MRRTWKAWATLGFQTVALGCAIVITLDGRHPPALAQSPSPTAADQHRDDTLASQQKDIDGNKASIAKEWDAINAMRGDIGQMKIDAAAKTNTSTYINLGEIGALLASIGLQVRPMKRRRRSEESEEDE